MANSQTRCGPMRDLREKTEALQIPLRPLPREASEGEAQINWEQALLGKQGYRTVCKGQESRTPSPRAQWPVAAPHRSGFWSRLRLGSIIDRQSKRVMACLQQP
jgi:hypothetical protein